MGNGAASQSDGTSIIQAATSEKLLLRKMPVEAGFPFRFGGEGSSFRQEKLLECERKH